VLVEGSEDFELAFYLVGRRRQELSGRLLAKHEAGLAARRSASGGREEGLAYLASVRKNVGFDWDG